MDTTQAQTSVKNINSELQSLTPSCLVTLFEIDLTNVIFGSSLLNNSEKYFRFHAEPKLINNSIYWQGVEYVAAPIIADGFEITTKGSTPTPKLSMIVNDESITQFTTLRQKIRDLGDIVGAKVTRIRTYTKFLDAVNFPDPNNQPIGFSPDPNAQLPKDIYFIERKAKETKNSIQYELTSAFDLQGIKLPGRLVIANTCPFTYRGAGCCYEYEDPTDAFRQRRSIVHEDASLPTQAVSVANDKDESIISILNDSNIQNLVDKGEWQGNATYNKGEQVFITIDSVNYYFVAKTAVIANQPPPNTNYWIEDACSKTLRGCRLRWASQTFLPFGGFPGVNRNLQ